MDYEEAYFFPDPMRAYEFILFYKRTGKQQLS